jgi:drug/metabolite transporter (DMT)-like permease
MTASGKARGRWGWAAVLLVAAIVFAALTQHAAAARLGAMIADVWVSTISVVVRLIAAIFGGH